MSTTEAKFQVTATVVARAMSSVSTPPTIHQRRRRRGAASSFSVGSAVGLSIGARLLRRWTVAYERARRSPAVPRLVPTWEGCGRRRDSQAAELAGGSSPYSPRVAKSIRRSTALARRSLIFVFVSSIGSTLGVLPDSRLLLHGLLQFRSEIWLGSRLCGGHE